VVRCPASFPNPINYGFAFNDSLSFQLGAIIATETRALWLLGAQEESAWSGRPHIGLDCWSPNININRDPRWGRNQEVCFCRAVRSS
jgi:beta-glucosidase-like glycosyl hydrolase